MVYKALGNYVFDFLLALLETDANLGGKHFGGLEAVRTILEFRRLIYRDLINNPYLR